MRSRLFPLLALTSLSVFGPGCAAILTGTKDTLTLSSGEPDTEFYVDGRPVGKGSSAVTQVPRKGNADTVLTARKDGCSDVDVPLPVTFNGHTLWGVFWDFGLVSILLVDGLATGSWTKAAQDMIYVSPDC